MAIERTYLYVPPEDFPDVQASGARWDHDSKRWYLPGHATPAAFSRWLAESSEESGFNIVSEKLFVASARMRCQHCEADIEVVCLFGASGEDLETEEPLENFSVPSVWSVDAGLAQQLKRWPNFRMGETDGDQLAFANYCPQCGAMQEEYLLHEEPGDIFFGISREDPGRLIFTPICGRYSIGGNYSFVV